MNTINQSIYYTPERKIDTYIPVFSSPKSMSATAAVAAATLAGLVLSYSMPLIALGATCAIFVINLYTIPLALKHGSTTLVKTVIIVSFAAFGSLIFGLGILTSNLMVMEILLSRIPLTIGNLIANTALLTGCVGYVAPYGLDYLKKAREIYLSETWDHAIKSLQESVKLMNYSPGWLSLFERHKIGSLFLNPLSDVLDKPGVTCCGFEQNFYTSSEIKDNLVRVLHNFNEFGVLPTLKDRIFILMGFCFLNDSDLMDYTELLLNKKSPYTFDTFKDIFELLHFAFYPLFGEKITSFYTEFIKFHTPQKWLDDLTKETVGLKSRFEKGIEQFDEDEIKKCIYAKDDLQKKRHDLQVRINEFNAQRNFWTTRDDSLVNWLISQFKKKPELKNHPALGALEGIMAYQLKSKDIFDNIDKHICEIDTLLKMSSPKSFSIIQEDPSFLYLISSNTIDHKLLVDFLIKTEEKNMDLCQFRFNEVGLKTEKDIKINNFFSTSGDLLKEQVELRKKISETTENLAKKDFSSLEMEFKKLIQKKEFFDKHLLNINQMSEREYETFKVHTKNVTEMHLKEGLVFDDNIIVIETLSEARIYYQNSSTELNSQFEKLKIELENYALILEEKNNLDAQYNKNEKVIVLQPLNKLKNYFENYNINVNLFFDSLIPTIWDNKEFLSCLNAPSSKNQAIERLLEIGLETKKDLDTYNIIPSDIDLIDVFNHTDSNEEIMTKHYQQVLLNNLKKHIENQISFAEKIKKGDFKATLPIQFTLPSIQELSTRIQVLIYRLITTGLVLVPVYLFPVAAGLSLPIGLVYSGLRRFGCPDFLKSLENRAFANQPDMMNLCKSIFSRHIFSLTPFMKNDKEIFLQSDFFGKARLISFHLSTTFLLINPIGSAARGISLGGEAMDLVGNFFDGTQARV